MSSTVDMYRRGNTIKHIVRMATLGKSKLKKQQIVKEVYTDLLAHYHELLKEWRTTK